MQNIADWLRDQKLEAHIEAFEREGITVEMLHALSDDDLKQLGITKIGERRGLQQAAAALRAAATPPAAPRAGALDGVLNHLGGTTDGEQAPPGGVAPNDPMLKVVFGGAGLMLLSMLMPWLEGRSSASGFGQSFSASGGTLIGLGTVWGYLGAGLAAAAIQQTRKGFRRAWMFGLASFAVVAGQLIDADGSKVSSSFMGASASARLAPQFGIAAFALGGLVLTIGAFRLRGERTQAEAIALRGMAALVALGAIAMIVFAHGLWPLWLRGNWPSSARRDNLDALGWIVMNVGACAALVWAAASALPHPTERLRAEWARQTSALGPDGWAELARWAVRNLLVRGPLAWAAVILLAWASSRFDAPMVTRALQVLECGVIAAVLGATAHMLYKRFDLWLVAAGPAYLSASSLYAGYLRFEPDEPVSAKLTPQAAGCFAYSVPLALGVGLIAWAHRRLQGEEHAAQRAMVMQAVHAAGPVSMGVSLSVLTTSFHFWMGNWALTFMIAAAFWGALSCALWSHLVYRDGSRPAAETYVAGLFALAAPLYMAPGLADATLGEHLAILPVVAALGAGLTLALSATGLPRMAGRVMAPLLAGLFMLAPKLPFGSVVVSQVVLRPVAPEGKDMEVYGSSLDGAKLAVGGAPLAITEGEVRVPAGPNTWTVEHPLAEGPVTLQLTPVPDETLTVDVPVTKGFLQVQYRDAEGQDLEVTATPAAPPPFLLDGKPLAALTKDEQGRYVVSPGTHEVSLQDPEWTRDSEQVTVYAGGTYVADMGLVVREAKPVVPPPSGTVTITSAVPSSALPPTTLGGVSYSFAASNLHDGRLDTSWQPKHDGGTPSVRLSFAPTRLAQLRVANGFQATDANGDMFAANRRVAKLTVTTSNGWSQGYTLADERGWVTLTLEDTAPASWVELRIDATYDNARWPDVALSEVQVVGAEATAPPADASTAGASQGLQPPAWIIALGAFPDAAQADAFIAKSAQQGHAGLSKLWIPDWPSLSGRPLFVVYDGPVPYAEREQARQRMLAAKAWSPGAYAVKIDRSAGREEIRQ